MNRLRIGSLCAVRAWVALLGCWLAQAQTLRVPDGFVIECAAPEGMLSYPMFVCFDDEGHLYVAESSGLDLYEALQKQTRRCRVKQLTDEDGDGVYEKATVFADNLVFPMGLAWRDGRLYVADPPDLITLEDANSDGVGENRKAILSGFGHTDNGSLHGLIFGPDGWLYLTMGQPDGYNLPRGDGTSVKSQVGALLRCRADGSQVEVLASGFENLVEVVFLPAGEIVGTLNWFSMPQDGLRDALVMLTPGGRYPLKGRATVSPEFFEGELLPALAHYPAVALSGLELYRGRAFPEMRGNLFSAQFNARKIVRHELSRRGASFRSADHDFVTTDDPDVHFSDVLEDADDSLLAVDTGSWYVHHCPTGRIRNSPATGGLWRVRHRDWPRQTDPRGLKLDWKTPSTAQLTERLLMPEPVIRERARVALERRSEASVHLARLVLSDEPLAARASSAWALGTNTVPLRSVLQRGDDPLAPLAARVLGRRQDSSAEPELLIALHSDQPELRLAAAEALATAGSPAMVPELVRRLAVDDDPWLVHVSQFALHRNASIEQLKGLLTHDSPHVQRAGLILLDQPNRHALEPQALFPRLSASNSSLRSTAIRLLERHPEWADASRDILIRLLAKERFEDSEDRLLEVLAKILKNDPALSVALEEAVRPTAPGWRQVKALQVIQYAAVVPLPLSWSNILSAALQSSSALVRCQAAYVAGQQPTVGWATELAAILGGTRDAAPCRLAALRALIRRTPSLDATALSLLEVSLRNSDSSVLEAGEIIGRSRPTGEQIGRLVAVGAKQHLFDPTHLISAARNSHLTGTEIVPLAEFVADRIERGWTAPPDVLSWLVKSSSAAQATRIRAAQSARAEAQATQLGAYMPLLARGNPKQGEKTFERVGCVVCHRVDLPGDRVGPDLSRIGAIRSGRDLLESVLFPSLSFAQGYETFRARLPDGEILAGVRVRTEANAVILRDGSGNYFHLPRDISLEVSPVSVMPEGLLGGLSPDEIANLFAYLQSLK